MSLDFKSSTERVSGRRQRHRAEMRERIIAGAASCFAEFGVDATTMEAVAVRADVARATVFNHFGDKQQLLIAYFDRRRNRLYQVLNDAGSSGEHAVTRLTRVIDAWSDLYEQNAREASATLDAWRRMPDAYSRGAAVADVFYVVIESGQAEGELDARLDARGTALALFDACIGAISRWLESTAPRPDLKTILHTTLTIMTRGITS